MTDSGTDEDAVATSNWGGNVAYRAARRHLPATLDELASIVRASKHVRALGTRHSFNRLADTDGDLISVAKLRRVFSLDTAKQTVTLEAGITYGALGANLHARGFALENLPSLPHVCVGGAVQTGTHGSGTANLARAVVAMKLVTADGSVVDVSRERDGDAFDGMVVALGTLGIVVELTLKIRRTFDIVQEVYEQVPIETLLEHFEAVTTAAYSVSFFTDWQTDRVNQVWFKREVADSALPTLPFGFLEGTRAKVKRHPIVTTAPDFCTEQNVPGPWHERLPHFRHDAPPSSAGAELQSEFFVSRRDAAAALRAISNIGPQLKECLMISEVRTVRPDSLWLSPCYQRDSVGIHFTWEPKEAQVRQRLKDVVEPALKPFQPRPHWGKVFTLDAAEVRARYTKLEEFRSLAARLDRGRKFRNPFVDEFLFEGISK